MDVKRFKLVTVVLLLLCFMMMNFSRLFILISFYANRNEIVNTYCVNKNNLSLHCNGKCFLMRVLEKEAQREKEIHEYFSKMPVMLCSHYFPISINKSFVPVCPKEWHREHDTLFRKFDFFNKILRPPSAVSA